jgi:predicted acylesterase/phospholipase RssA/CRP-like cAMP-binding protein
MTLGDPLKSAGVARGMLASLAASPLFGSLPDAALTSLEPELSSVRLRSGETLFAAGEPGDALYVVVFGRLRAVLRDPAHGDQVLGEIGRGESVGEMALLTGDPRSATVCAVRDTVLIKLTKAAFERVVARQPQVMLEMARLIIARYQRHIRSSAQIRPVALAIVPCTEAVAATEVAAALVRALSPGHRVLSLDAGRLQREYRPSEPDADAPFESAELAGWLQEQELQHDYLVYAGDPRPSPWTRLCVRQADLVLLVADAGSVAELRPELRELLRATDGAGLARRELVLLYDSQRAMPGGTAEWLAQVAVSAHHHVDPGRPADFERLARLLTGRAIGLVLGGGGARGLAHIGVIRALEEARIPIDLVGGTSSGSIVGGQFASGWESGRILAESRKVLVENGSLNDFTLPVMALLRGRRYLGMLEKLFGERRIEDLPITFFCVSTNLTRSTCMVHRTGLVRRGIAASCAVPGLGPPVALGRDILVDGGVINNLPVDIMRGLGRGPVFASSVSPLADLCLDREYLEMPSPWRLLVNWVNPFATRMVVPSIASTLMRTVSLPQLTARERADLVVEPPCEAHRLLDWRSIDQIMDTGYRAAVVAIEQWQSQQPRSPALSV